MNSSFALFLLCLEVKPYFIHPVIQSPISEFISQWHRVTPTLNLVEQAPLLYDFINLHEQP